MPNIQFPSSPVPPAPPVSGPVRQTTYKTNDIVLTPGRNGKFIITGYKPNRPRYQYNGIKIGGQGAQYKLGVADILGKIGEAPEDHPALVAFRSRQGGQSPGVSGDYKRLVQSLCQFVKNGEQGKAMAMVTALEALDV